MISSPGDQKSIFSPSKNKLKVLSFFSGAMGLDIGLHNMGFETLLACEIDRASRETIIANNPGIGLIGDIRSYTTGEIIDHAGLRSTNEVDLIVGGPPCQAFSSAGKRMGLADERGNVFLKFIQIIEDINPKFAVIENVRGLLSAAFDVDLTPEEEAFLPPSQKGLSGATMFYVFNRLRAAGYRVSFNLYNAANFGTPQVRERVVIVCSKINDHVPFLKPTHSKEGDFNLPRWKTLRQAIGDLKCTEKDYIKFPEKRLKYYRLLNAGQNWRCLSIELQKEALGKAYELNGGKTGFLRRLDWEKPAPTLVTHPAMPATDLGHPLEDRPLSVQEYKRIQEFPDSWQIKGSLLNQYKQIGNAVPVSVGEAIGRLIIELNSGIIDRTVSNFKYSRYLKTSDQEFIRDFLIRGQQLKKETHSTQLSLFP
jgi:DNA (cytosine-5)-methyltransferase 1